MPHPQTQLDLYALALALVHDENIAGDLYVRARNAEHLQRLAHHWRRKNGLSDPPLAGPPYLSVDQIEFGLHLARRRARRQQMRLTGAGVLGIALVAALALLPGLTAVTRPLLRDPVYAGVAAEEFGAPEQVVLEVYKAEATMGAITVWWAISGRQAERADAPRLALNEGQVMIANRVETARKSSGRILGKSQFDLMTVKLRRVSVTVDDHFTGSRMVGVDVDLTRVPDADARVVTLDKTLVDGTGLQAGVLTQVVLGSTYTIVQYRPEPANLGGFELLADDRPLEYVGENYQALLENDTQEFLFAPVPAGTRSLTLTPGSGPSGNNMRVPMDPRLLQMYWVGTELRGLIRLPKEVRVLSCAVTFFDSASRRYSGSIRPIGEEDQANAYELSTNNVASGIELRDVSLSIFWADPSMRVTIDLAN